MLGHLIPKVNTVDLGELGATDPRLIGAVSEESHGEFGQVHGGAQARLGLKRAPSQSSKQGIGRAGRNKSEQHDKQMACEIGLTCAPCFDTNIIRPHSVAD